MRTVPAVRRQQQHDSSTSSDARTTLECRQRQSAYSVCLPLVAPMAEFFCRTLCGRVKLSIALFSLSADADATKRQRDSTATGPLRHAVLGAGQKQNRLRARAAGRFTDAEAKKGSHRAQPCETHECPGCVLAKWVIFLSCLLRLLQNCSSASAFIFGDVAGTPPRWHSLAPRRLRCL